MSADIPEATTIASRKPNPQRTLSSTQYVFAAILAIGLMLAIQFSSRITAERDLNLIYDAVADEIALLEREQQELINQLDFVRGDAYVAQWARAEAMMVQDGMRLVHPIPSTNTIEQTSSDNRVVSTVALDTTIPEPEPWQIWWALFFDSPPPSF